MLEIFANSSKSVKPREVDSLKYRLKVIKLKNVSMCRNSILDWVKVESINKTIMIVRIHQ